MPILNYTTQIDVNKSVTEIQRILAKGNAEQITVDYKNGQPSGLQFMITFTGQPVYFRLPCNVDGVYKTLCRTKVAGRFKTTEQARRIAWRIIKDWIEAQLAIVEAQQAELVEVFLPYAVGKGGETVFESFVNNQKLLSA